MKFRSLMVVAALFSSSFLQAEDKERVVLVGDSTVASRSGWGDSFGEMLAPGVGFANHGRGGRSSKSYRDEGWWKKALAEEPTWVFIQFGHNDQPGKGPKLETDPETTFRENLSRYVEEARAAGAKPVLVTSLTRRNFNDRGKIDVENLVAATDGEGRKMGDHLNDYAKATRAAGVTLEVPVIDLHALSIAQMNRLGPEEAAKFDPPAKNPQFPDKTHLSGYGAKMTAELVAAEVRRKIPEFVPLLNEPEEMDGRSSQD